MNIRRTHVIYKFYALAAIVISPVFIEHFSLFMTKQEIRNKVKQLSTMEDMLNLLNEIKAEQMGNSLHPFTMKQLEYYSYSKNIKRSYHHFRIQKKTKKNGKPQYREIHAPKGTLKWILEYLNIILQAMYDAPECATGFVPGRSIVENAAFHTGRHYVFNIDLEDFFPSIKQTMVWKKLHYVPFNFRDYTRKDGKVIKRLQFANFIANICCYPSKIEEGKRNGHLPQGAPTSPFLTNIICERLDYQLTGLAKRFGLKYSRYADDITFSSDHNVYRRDGDFQKELRRIIESHDFKINDKKTRLLRDNMKQEVTGLVVNEKANVTKKYVKNIRHILHTWQTKGYSQAYADFYMHYKKEKGHVKKGEPSMENVVSGKLEFLKMVKGAHSSTYISLRKQFEKLYDAHNKRDVQYIESQLTYIFTTTFKEFENMYSTEIMKGIAKDGRPYLYFMLNNKKMFISHNKDLSISKVDDLKRFFISYCESTKGDRFYLIHKYKSNSSVEKKNEDYMKQKLQKLVASDFDLKLLLSDE